MPSRRSSVNEMMLHTAAEIFRSFCQQLGSGDHFAQDGSRAEELHLAAFAQPVHAAQDALGRALRRCRVRIVLVGDGDVVEDILLGFEHAPRAILDDARELVAEAGIEGAANRNGARREVRGPVLMLQAFAASVVRPAVPPTRKPRARESAAAQIRSPTRWKPKIE